MKYIFTFLFATVMMSTVFSQVEKTVIVEHFTNTRCGTCAAKNPAFYEVLNDYPDVLHIAYHPSSPFPACIFSQHNPTENDARAYYYDIYGPTPLIVLQGKVVGIQSPMINPEQIESELGQESDFSLSIQHTLSANNKIEVTIHIERVSGSGSEEVSFYAVLAEKEIAYNAPNGETLHHDVFRMVIDEESVLLPNIGSSKTIVKTIDIDDEWVADEMVAIGILQNAQTKETLQSAESTSTTSLFENNTSEAKALLYPNPVANNLYIQANERERFISADIYSLLGNKVVQFINVNKMDMTDLLPGYYFVVLTDVKGNRTTSKITKSY